MTWSEHGTECEIIDNQSALIMQSISYFPLLYDKVRFSQLGLVSLLTNCYSVGSCILEVLQLGNLQYAAAYCKDIKWLPDSCSLFRN